MDHEALPLPAGAILRQAGRTCFHHLVSTTPALLQVYSGTKVVIARDMPLRLVAGEFALLPDHQPMTMENIPKAPQNYEARLLPIPRALFEETYARIASVTQPQTALPVKARGLPAESTDLPVRLSSHRGSPAIVRAQRLISEAVTERTRTGAPSGPRTRPRAFAHDHGLPQQ